MLLDPGFLKRETLDLLFTSQRTSAGTETGYGIGWFLRADSAGHRWAFHGGSAVGGTAVFGLGRGAPVVVAVFPKLSDPPVQAVQANAKPVAPARRPANSLLRPHQTAHQFPDF